MNSITASTVSPISTLNLTDTQYSTTVNWPAPATTGYTSVLSFPNIGYPTTGKMIVQLSSTAITNTTGSYVYSASLQHSMDNVTFTNVDTLNTSLLTTTDSGGSAPATSVQVMLNPSTTKKWLRAGLGCPSNQVNSTGSASPSGSFQLEVEF